MFCLGARLALSTPTGHLQQPVIILLRERCNLGVANVAQIPGPDYAMSLAATRCKLHVATVLAYTRSRFGRQLETLHELLEVHR